MKLSQEENSSREFLYNIGTAICGGTYAFVWVWALIGDGIVGTRKWICVVAGWVTFVVIVGFPLLVAIASASKRCKVLCAGAACVLSVIVCVVCKVSWLGLIYIYPAVIVAILFVIGLMRMCRRFYLMRLRYCKGKNGDTSN